MWRLCQCWCLSLCQCKMFTVGLSVWHLFRMWSGLFHGVLGETSQTQFQFVQQICTFSPKRESFASLCFWSLSSVDDNLHQVHMLMKRTCKQLLGYMNQKRVELKRWFYWDLMQLTTWWLVCDLSVTSYFAKAQPPSCQLHVAHELWRILSVKINIHFAKKPITTVTNLFFFICSAENENTHTVALTKWTTGVKACSVVIFPQPYIICLCYDEDKPTG